MTLTTTQPQSADPAPTDTALEPIRIALPKGRMLDGISKPLADAGIRVKPTARGYRPKISMRGFEAKMLKPQNIVTMLAAGSRDCGFAGADWVEELTHEIDQRDHELVDLLDTGLDPVRVVAAAPRDFLVAGKLPNMTEANPLRVAGEMEYLATQWIKKSNLNARFVRTYGATEVFPPEDADCIIDITQTGATLEANNLVIVDDLMRSSTRFYASSRALEDKDKRRRIEDFVVLLKGVLEARDRVMLEVNVTQDNLPAVIKVLPAMRNPTVSQLHEEGGYAVKIAAKRADLPSIIPQLKAAGGTDIIISPVQQVIV